MTALEQAREALNEVFVIGDRLVSDVYGSEFLHKAKEALAAIDAALSAQEVPAGEPWGWAIVDKNGDEQLTLARLSRFFGVVNHEADPYDADDLARADRESPGLAPHRIVTLYAAPAAPQD